MRWCWLCTAGVLIWMGAACAQVRESYPAPHHPSPARSAHVPSRTAPNEVHVLNQPSDWHLWASQAASPQEAASLTSGGRSERVEVRSSMPALMPESPPSFQALDTDNDGRITPEEASAYPLLANDFLYASQNKRWISQARYAWWVRQF